MISQLVMDRARTQIRPKPLYLGVCPGYQGSKQRKEEDGVDVMSELRLKGGSLPRGKVKVFQRKRNNVKKPKAKRKHKFQEQQTEQSYIQQLIHHEGFSRKLLNIWHLLCPLLRIPMATVLNCDWKDRQKWNKDSLFFMIRLKVWIMFNKQWGTIEKS